MPDGRSGAGSGNEPLPDRLAAIEARLKSLADADDNASWGRPTASRGGFRREQAELAAEAERIRAEMEGRA
jgi:hypothetical protein